MDIRTDKINQHLKNPQNIGWIDKPDAVSEAGSAGCRNLVKLSAAVKGNQIEEIRFKALGCSWTIAAASYITTLAKGKNLLDAAKIGEEDIYGYFGDFPDDKKNAASSAAEALARLITAYMSRHQNNLYPLKPGRIAVAMSGGIDSSMAAWLLKKEGFELIGLTMNIFAPEEKGQDNDKTCCSPKDIRLAKKVCARLGIPHLVIDLENEFKENIIQDFLDEYLQGRTPNPCVECNRFIKFGHLLKKADMLGASSMASGHYCRSEKTGEGVIIKKGKDDTKDQSYMLWRLGQHQLERIKFPLGPYHKSEIKKMGQKYFPFLAQRPESQDICFMGEEGYHHLLSGFTIRPGKIINGRGQVLGTHKGFPYYTIGQRRGLGLSWPRPLYVKEIIPSKNVIVVGEKEELLKKGFKSEDMNFIAGKAPASSFKALVMIRYKSEPAEALITMSGKNSAYCNFKKPQMAITPGQSAVFYQKDLLLGGGVISK